MRHMMGYSGWGGLAFALCSACSLTRSLDDLESQPSGQHCQSDADCQGGLCSNLDKTCHACPSEMRLVSFANGDAYCIDQMEVSQRDYQDFLRAVVGHPDSDFSDLFCASNADYSPGSAGDCEHAFQPEVSPLMPVTCVDTCDAAAYCIAHGKRLCGGPLTGPLSPEKFNDVSYDQWFLACAGLENRLFPYSGSYSSEACNVTSERPMEVGSFPECASPEGVLDLSGNVAEWTNNCWIVDDLGLRCLVRGGSYQSPKPAVATCAFDATQTPAVPPLMPPIVMQLPSVGVRCCLN